MKIKQILATLVFLTGIGTVALSPVVGALEKCGGVDTSIIECKETGTKNLEDTGVWGLLMFVINILTMGVGVAAVGGVVYGSVLYTTASGSVDQTKKAKHIILNTVVGIIAYALMYAALNFLVPGGVFK
ncbi:MAG: hypothetical protein ACM3KH_00385 [Thiobacillus sp.]